MSEKAKEATPEFWARAMLGVYAKQAQGKGATDAMIMTAMLERVQMIMQNLTPAEASEAVAAMLTAGLVDAAKLLDAHPKGSA